jgi:hypothetical protein
VVALATLFAATQCVLATPGFDLAAADEVAGPAAIGLVVPDAGPSTSEARARSSLARGEVSNSLRGDAPSGPALIRTDCMLRGTVVGIPLGGEQANDRRYAVVVPGRRGLLSSDSTRIPGLVSIADVARARVEVSAHQRPLEQLAALDRRIDANGDWRRPVTLGLLAALALAAFAAPAAALAGFPVALLGNLALGAAGVAGAGALVLAGAPLLGSGRRVALLAAATIAAYGVALAAEPTWVALSPLGPSQNSRFYGLSNVLSAFLLPVALVAAVHAWRRFGWPGFAAVAAPTVIVVGGATFGADAGGALVLVAAFAVLAALLARRARAAFVTAAGVVAVAGLAVALGPATHVTESLTDGPRAAAADFVDRVELSWLRATADLPTAFAVAIALILLGLAVSRGPRSPLPLALAAGVAVSLVVNDSPLEVVLVGLVAYVAVSRSVSPGRRTRPRRGSALR